MATRYGHLCFFVQDLEKSRSFYLNNFDMVLDKEVPGDNGVVKQIFIKTSDGMLLELWEQQDNGPMHGHVAFWVDDIVAFSAGLRANGIVVSAPDLRPSGNTIAFLEDPDCNTIELLCAPH
ncbi:MAG: VOC family protein [bacterium]